MKCSECGCEGIHACMGKPHDGDIEIQPCTKKLEAWLKRANQSITVGDPPLTSKQQAETINFLNRNDKRVRDGKEKNVT